MRIHTSANYVAKSTISKSGESGYIMDVVKLNLSGTRPSATVNSDRQKRSPMHTKRRSMRRLSGTSFVKVVDLDGDHLRLQVRGEFFDLPFSEYPWFKDARSEDIRFVRLLSGFHLRWPNLDIDLEVDSLRHPERYPRRWDRMPDGSPVDPG